MPLVIYGKAHKGGEINRKDLFGRERERWRR
jgi:hypothetical protein